MIRVLLAEDMHLVRGALVALLNLEPDIEVVAEVHTGDAVVPTAMAHRPDVAVIDVYLPVMDGLAAAAELHRLLPECRTLILTGLFRPGNLRRAVAAHTSGFMLKDAPPAQLAEAVRRVAAGDLVVDPELAMLALRKDDSPLTAREIDVLRLTAEGGDVAEIAARLFLSVGTVRNHLTTIVTKLNARSRVDAVRIAHDAGWL
ncbi:response regulator transcription factor [Nonomuraea sp. NPDC049152]|uniref:response regulator transcription factor n=1 Tax=Nonomuraea sp. NPDC049152 TaxID=3154350 RepID=UPI0033D550F3